MIMLVSANFHCQVCLSVICLEFQMINGKSVIMCDEEDCDNLIVNLTRSLRY